jgi:signal transduction histidine kinase
MVKPETEVSKSPLQPEDGRVVYRRAEADGGPAGAPRQRRRLAPAVTPLIIGFLLLLLVIFTLGYLSVGRTDEVSTQVLDLERQYSARVSLLLQLRLALTKLDYEARERRDAEGQKQLLPPFEIRLRNARGEMRKLVPQLDHPPLSTEPKWQQFRIDLQAYLEVTDDLRRYSLEGFPKFNTVDHELNDLFQDSSANQERVVGQSEAIVQAAARFIRFWSIIALLVGALVAAGTISEVQRRFREMRHSMDEVRRERSFSNQMLEGMVSAIVAIDQNDHIRSANRAFFEIYPGASIGASLRESFAPEDAMKILEAAIGSRTDTAAYRGRWVCRPEGPGTTEKTFDLYVASLAIDGDVGEIVTLVDATEAAEAERTQRRSESLAAVGQATTQVAHEIRNPLGSIKLGVSMLRDSVNDPEALKTIDVVDRGIDHLNKLVVDVTQFSSRKPLTRSDTDLRDLLGKSLDLVADRIAGKDITINKEFKEESIHGNWDADQLSQLFVNVIANAVDASPERAPITIATEIVSSAGPGNQPSSTFRRYARVTIADRGKGIEAATLERLFEPFFTTKKRGTGLGLAIVKQIVELHEGKIAVESESGKGTQFTIDLPL